MRSCPRTIDRPLLIMGLEGEDIAVLMMSFGIPAVLFSPAIPLVLMAVCWPVLAVLKRGKPEGYVLHLLYQAGAPLDGLLPPGDGIRFSPYPAQFFEEDGYEFSRAD